MSSEATPSEVNKVTVRRFYEQVFSQGNLEVANDIFTDGYVLHDREADPDQNVRGPEGIADLVRRMRETFSGLEVSIIGEPMTVEGNQVVTRFALSGSFEDTTVNVEGMSISQVSEGKITESWSYWESSHMYQQLGAIRTFGPPGLFRPPWGRGKR
jgi:predicted SnoaL-like aldol condensation-catalyzing enzyme